jgi:hypothetical protein
MIWCLRILRWVVVSGGEGVGEEISAGGWLCQGVKEWGR